MDLLRPFVVGEPLATEGEQVRLAHRLAEHDRRRDLFAPRGMRHAEADRFRDLRMREQHFVDFPRRYFLAAAVDQLFDPADECQIAVCIEHALIAGPKPAIDERRRVRIRIVLVPANDVRALDDDLAALTGSEVLSCRVHDADLHIGAATHRSRFAGGRRQRVGSHLMRRFGHAVRLEHRRSEGRLEIVHHLRRQRRAAGSNEPQLFRAGRLARFWIRPRKQQLVKRRHGGVPRGADVLCGAPERQRIELARNDDGAASRQRRQRGRNEAMHVKQRHHAERHVVAGQRIAARDVLRRDREVRVRQRHALRPAGAAARVQDEGNIIDGRGNKRPAIGRAHERDAAGGVHVDR